MPVDPPLIPDPNFKVTLPSENCVPPYDEQTIVIDLCECVVVITCADLAKAGCRSALSEETT